MNAYRTLVTCLLIVISTVVSFGQKTEPVLHVLNDQTSNLTAIWGPFIKTLKNSKYGKNLHVATSFAEVTRSENHGNFWVLLSVIKDTDGEWNYSCVLGMVDECNNAAYGYMFHGNCTGPKSLTALAADREGYYIGNRVIEFLDDTLSE